MIKFVCILLVVILVSLPLFFASASDQVVKEYSIDPELGEVLKQAFDTEERGILQNKDLYRGSAIENIGVVIDDQPIVQIHDEVHWYISHLPLNDILSRCSEEKSADYVVFDIQPIRIRKTYATENKDLTVVVKSRETVDINFIKDIQGLKAESTILEQNCKISNVVAFDGYTSLDGAALYVESDQGVFVKYYRDQNDDGTWFREEDYRKWAKEYYEYLISPENNIGKNGEYIGGRKSFLDLVEAQEESLGADVDDALIDQEVSAPKPTFYIWIIAIVGVILLCSTVFIIVFRKRRFKF